MRKRLTEKFTRAKRGSLGYTLTEMLVVVGIIAALCAIAIPSIFAIRNALRFATANNYAKSIFLAAQQNLTELRSDGGLGPVREAAGASEIPGAVTTFPDAYRAEYVYTVTGTEAFERVLPAGSIDAELRNDQIVIEYNPVTGNVYSVFYFDKDAAELNLEQTYEGGNLPREKSERRKLMVGYYDGSGLNSAQIELEKTQATVEFINGEEGIVQVKVPMPESFYGNFSEFAEGLNVSLTLTGEWSMSQPADPGETPQVLTLQVKTAGTQDGCTLAADGKTVVLSYVIDSLASRRSFVNFASGTQAATGGGVANSAASLTTLVDEESFIYNILPGENITIQADVTFTGEGSELVEIEPGILSGVNPMFEYLQPIGNNGYVLAISNGRNLQNLNAIAPTIADMVQNVTFVSDIYWNDTVAYYNNKYASGSTYRTGAMVGSSHVYDEAPARALPYFVPIHNEKLFGTARFIYPGDGDGGLGAIINNILGALGFGQYTSSAVPTLTDEMDNRSDISHASIQGNGHGVYNINIDSTKYQIPNEGKKANVVIDGELQEKLLTGTFYATGENQIVDYCFTGLFGYVNTPINSLRVVNPIVKGFKLERKETSVPNYILGFIPAGTKTAYLYNNPATGALLGAGGYNTLITNCSTYIDKNARGYMSLNWGPYTYDAANNQNWYGVSGTGAVGGLVGYAKSHRSVTGELTDSAAHIAFSRCFAAVPVSGEMRANKDKNFGYSNGVGALIGNSQLTNFYNCYASGDVLATGCRVSDTLAGGLANSIAQIFGVKLDMPYNGRTSWGAGGFVGTSHGTRYTNCFSTGDVSASSNASSLGAGGFVGFMSIDETFTYGNKDSSGNEKVAQRTVFTDCYSVGVAVTNGSNYENFSGANGRIAFELNQTMTYYVGDYFRLYAPHYANQNQTAPGYEDVYIYRDTYFMSNYHDNVKGQDSSSHCASPDTYASFTDMVGNHVNGSQWMLDEIQEIKDIVLYTEYDYSWNGREEITHTYDTDYFQKRTELNRIYQELYAEGYSEDDWESATASTTHPYSLTEGNRYPFTKLKGMDYYGDWPSKPSDVGLAYYETYDDTDKTHYFFDQDHTEYESLTLRSDINAIVQKDGYSIFSASDADLKVTIGNVTETLKAEKNQKYTVAQKAYYVFKLTDTLMAVQPADGEYYVKVTASHVDSGDTYTMYYNPNVGLSHVNPVESKLAAVKPDKAPTTIYVRSARQFKGIATLDDFWGENTRFIQQLNIDASKYDWGKNVAVPKLNAIGADGENTRFESDYSAGYTLDIGEEGRYKIAGFTSADLAMFGAIGEKGSISNLIIECGDFTAGSDKAENAAILAAANYGQIDNVALNISGNVTLTATNNAGLLAGLTTGDITKCDVTTAEKKTVNINALNAGGMIGAVEGTGEVPEGATEAARIAVNKSTLTVAGTLNLTGGAGNAGGLIGKASYMSCEDLSVNINSLTGDTLYLGGLAGYVANSDFTGTAADANGNNPVEVTVTTIKSTNTDGYAAGVLGYAEHTALVAMDVRVDSVTGNIAAGYLGNTLDVDATNCDVVVTGSITGTAGAAGVAGIVGPQSVFSDVPVLLSGVKLQGADAAGYALEVKGDAYVMGNSHVTLGNSTETKTTISATANAAGFAVTTAGTVGETNVVGFGAINGNQAAGFAINVSGNIASCHVSPALANENYLGNANANLEVTGNSAAAGFAMTLAKDSTIANSYTLCKISADGKVPTEGETPSDIAAAYGFVGTNNGTINRCMNNVDIGDGYAFVGVNNGLVTTSYGWFGDGDRNNATLTKNEMTGSGKCYSSYFADLAPVNRTDKVVALYDADGNVSQVTPSALQLAAISGFVGGYNEYPYQAMDESEVEYPYPMLRDHYGNWITPPQYAYGVAYYEEYADGKRKLQMVDLSNPALTEEGQKGVTFINDTFDTTGSIVEAGYAKFYNSEMGEMEGKTFDLQIGDFTFDFYKIETVGVETIAATKSGTKAATIDTRFAKAIKVDESFGKNETFEVRTAEQLANIGAVAANFNQTHDIATTDVTAATIAKDYTYNGNGLKLDITGMTKAWLTSVAGTVKNLNLTVDAVPYDLFGNVSGTVEELNLTINGAVSANVFKNVSGTVNVDLEKLSSIAANGALVGTTSGTFTTGNIAPSEIAANGALFRNVKDGTVNVGNITTNGNHVNGAVFADVSGGTVTTGAITTAQENSSAIGNVAGAVFTTVAGNVTVNGDISVGEVNGKVFHTVSGGEVKVVNITTNGKAVNGSVFGSVSAPVTAQKIEIGTLAGKVFDTISGNVTVTNGVTANDATAENWLVGTVTGGTSNLGNIQAAKAVTTTSDGTDAEGKTTKITVTSYNAVPRMIGTVKNSTLNLGAVTLGNVTGVNGWLISATEKANVTVGDVTVNNGTTTVTTTYADDETVEETETVVEFANVNEMTSAISGGTVSGTTSVSTVNLGGADISGNLFTGVSNATLSNFKVTTDGNMGASLIGSVTDSDNSVVTTVASVSVKAKGVTAEFASNGLLVNTLGEGASVTGCDVVVTNPVAVSAATFGGITGTANAALSNNTVKATLNVVRVPADGETVIIGGLVGEMTGGSITGGQVSGAITRTSTGTTKNYIVGGAIGKMVDGEAEGVTVNVAVASNFVNTGYTVDQQNGNKTFGINNGITYQGPVGMFVGYAGDVTLKNCSSEDKNNATFQFLGEAMLSSKPITGDLWVTNTDVDSLITGELAATQTTGPVYAPYGGANVELNVATGNYYYVETELNGCTFYLKPNETADAEKKTQTVGANQYFYSMKSENTKMYTIGEAVKVALAGDKSKPYTVRNNTATIPTSAPEDTGYYVKVSDNLYAKAYVTSSRSDTYEWYGPACNYTYKLWYLNESGGFTEVNNSTKSATVSSWYGESATINFTGLYELPNNQKIVSNGAYLIVTDSTAVTGNSSGMSITGVTSFKNYDALYGYLYNYTEPNLTKGSESYTVALYDKYFTSTSQFATYTIGNLQYKGVTQFNLYPVSETVDKDHIVMTFTNQTSADQSRQYVTATPVGTESQVAEAMVIDTEATEPEVTEPVTTEPVVTE